MTALTVMWMRPSFFIGPGGDYGDVVIWIGPFYVSWNWGR